MLTTQFTKDTLTYRRFVKRKLDAGWEELGEGGGKIWELVRGGRWKSRIVAVEITPGGKSVFVKVEPE